MQTLSQGRPAHRFDSAEARYKLADPTRRAILARLAQGDSTVSELAEPFELAQPTISKHLRVFEDAGLIRQRRDAQRRPRSLVVGGPLKELDVWLGPFREQWQLPKTKTTIDRTTLTVTFTRSFSASREDVFDASTARRRTTSPSS